ncbi:MAG TPA: hypothetical protein VMS56_02835 [Thermoanaerobaculia bacterium]|nr:hypothetical protein [Thermoanaerobaculia bacterium]
MKTAALASIFSFCPLLLAAQSGGAGECDVAAAIDRLTRAVERNAEIDEAALLVERVRLGSAAGAVAEEQLRDALRRKRAIEDELGHIGNELTSLDERLTLETDPQAAEELRLTRRRIELRESDLRKSLQEAGDRLTLAEAKAAASRRELEEWLRYIDKVLARD